MITRAELDAIIQMLESEVFLFFRPLTVQYSTDPSQEADFYFFHGTKAHYRNAAHFWLRCMSWLEDTWLGFRLLMIQRYPDHQFAPVNVTPHYYLDAYTLYQSISPESFQATIEQFSSRLKRSGIPHTYHWEGQVQWAMQMSDQWNDQSFIAETENEFLVFHWETSA